MRGDNRWKERDGFLSVQLKIGDRGHFEGFEVQSRALFECGTHQLQILFIFVMMETLNIFHGLDKHLILVQIVIRLSFCSLEDGMYLRDDEGFCLQWCIMAIVG